MADNRKYYYLKLKESFFDGDSVVLLESMQDGILYSNILLKLYLKSLKNGGKLQLDEHIPYTAQMIATLTRHQIGTVERALNVFRQLGLVEQLDGGLLYMSDIELMIGQSSTEGERKRAARRENKSLLPQRTNGGHLSDIRPLEIEKEREIEIDIEGEREKETGHPPAAYGRYGNVLLSDKELAELKTELPDKWEYYIDRLSVHIASSGKKYNSHAATIFKWAQEDKEKTSKKTGGILDYILENREYTGCLVNFKTEKPSYKTKHSVENPIEKQMIFENHHEPIIDTLTWERVQELRKQRKRPNRYGEVGLFSGILFCADCGSVLYQQRYQTDKCRIGTANFLHFYYFFIAHKQKDRG